MIKNIKIELIVLGVIFLSILISYSIDIGLYNYFAKFDGSVGAKYLKEFFKNITSLGNSLWFFLIFLVLLFFSFLLKKLNIVEQKVSDYFKFFSLTGIVYLSTTGIITQILKHIVGRARPNHTNLVEGFGFNFFTTNSNFHSFPSGHTSTIFIVALLIGVLLPKMKYFFYCIAVVIALSRVVVGAHYTTDIIAGAVLSLIVFKTLNLYFDKSFSFLKPQTLKNLKINNFYYFLISFFLVALLLTLGPTFDLFISDLFYSDKKQFLLQSQSIVTIIFRNIILPLILIYVLVLPIFSKFFLIKKLFFGYAFSFKNILFLWSSLAISMLIIVNFLLKGFWGRARPNDVIQFGGDEVYTPWYKIADSCLTNCSFVSGDASVGFLLFALYLITNKIIYFYFALTFGLLLGLVRIGEGGHFLSDVVFSFLVITISLILMFLFYKKFYDK